MARYSIKPCEVEATQWFKNGDHPHDYDKPQSGLVNDELHEFTGAECKEKGWEGQVVRYFRRPDVAGRAFCGHCQQPIHAHGWIDEPHNVSVCPGDWVVTDEDGRMFTLTTEVFFDTFDPLED